MYYDPTTNTAAAYTFLDAFTLIKDPHNAGYFTTGQVLSINSRYFATFSTLYDDGVSPSVKFTHQITQTNSNLNSHHLAVYDTKSSYVYIGACEYLTAADYSTNGPV